MKQVGLLLILSLFAGGSCCLHGAGKGDLKNSRELQIELDRTVKNSLSATQLANSLEGKDGAVSEEEDEDEDDWGSWEKDEQEEKEILSEEQRQALEEVLFLDGEFGDIEGEEGDS